MSVTIERKKASFDLAHTGEQKQTNLDPVQSEEGNKSLIPSFPIDPELMNLKREKTKTAKGNKGVWSHHKSSDHKSYFNTQKPSVPNIFNNLTSQKERLSE